MPPVVSLMSAVDSVFERPVGIEVKVSPSAVFRFCFSLARKHCVLFWDNHGGNHQGTLSPSVVEVYSLSLQSDEIVMPMGPLCAITPLLLSPTRDTIFPTNQHDYIADVSLRDVMLSPE